MIRVEERDGWLLIRHPDHARLAGDVARYWGNDQFKRPEPFEDVCVGVARHDDAWEARDAAPEITPDERPSAFSRELVGTYSAFENIDLKAYLQVRGEATEKVAGDNPLAAILVSMHTVNLLTEQADLSTLNEGQRVLHAEFIKGQTERQKALKTQLPSDLLESTALEDGFRFLQACDSLSLMACVGYDQPLALRHGQRTHAGERVEIRCHPGDNNRFRLDPYPLAEPEVRLEIPARKIHGATFPSDAHLREAWSAGSDRTITITLHRD